MPQITKVKTKQAQAPAPILLGDWIKLLDKFMKLKPLVSKGETDGVETIHQKEGIRHHALSLGADQVQLQRLATLTLEDHVGKRLYSFQLDEKMRTATWVEFKGVSDHKFLSEVIKAMRWAEFHSLEQGELLVVDFKQKFITL